MKIQDRPSGEAQKAIGLDKTFPGLKATKVNRVAIERCNARTSMLDYCLVDDSVPILKSGDV